MSYRKIKINNNVYEYVIGKTHTKIKNIGLFHNDEIGHDEDVVCDCCGEPLSVLYDKDDDASSFFYKVVTPRDIRRVILETING